MTTEQTNATQEADAIAPAPVTQQTVLVKVTDIAGNKVSHPMRLDGVVALDNTRLIRRAFRAGLVTADDAEVWNAKHTAQKHTGLEARRADVSRMRQELTNAKGLNLNGMLRAVLKGC